MDLGNRFGDDGIQWGAILKDAGLAALVALVLALLLFGVRLSDGGGGGRHQRRWRGGVRGGQDGDADDVWRCRHDERQHHLHPRGDADRLAKPTELKFIVSAAVDRCAGKEPVPTLDLNGVDAILEVDAEQFTMVLSHLIKNAQDATPDDGEVQVELQSDGTACTIIVSDSGTGMDEKFIRERLFRPFDSTKGSQGMGIGAYQVRETVRASGGDVIIESAPGAGTKIRLNLPVCESKRVSK